MLRCLTGITGYEYALQSRFDPWGSQEINMKQVVVQKYGWHGVGFGSALAMAISFNVNHSLGWAILHGLFSWFYVIYFAVFK